MQITHHTYSLILCINLNYGNGKMVPTFMFFSLTCNMNKNVLVIIKVLLQRNQQNWRSVVQKNVVVHTYTAKFDRNGKITCFQTRFKTTFEIKVCQKIQLIKCFLISRALFVCLKKPANS